MATIYEVKEVCFHFPNGDQQLFTVGKSSDYFVTSDYKDKIISSIGINNHHISIRFERSKEYVDMHGTFSVINKVRGITK